jgi:hypothetical protein
MELQLCLENTLEFSTVERHMLLAILSRKTQPELTAAFHAGAQAMAPRRGKGKPLLEVKDDQMSGTKWPSPPSKAQ